MDTQRLRQVRTAILASDKRGLFDMGCFGPADGRNPADCGTNGCVAGHAVVEFAPKSQVKQLAAWFEDEERHGSTNSAAVAFGAWLLDLPLREAYRLFYASTLDQRANAKAPEVAKSITQLTRRKVGRYDGPKVPAQWRKYGGKAR